LCGDKSNTLTYIEDGHIFKYEFSNAFAIALLSDQSAPTHFVDGHWQISVSETATGIFTTELISIVIGTELISIRSQQSCIVLIDFI
jgi:hypothetical protein